MLSNAGSFLRSALVDSVVDGPQVTQRNTVLDPNSEFSARFRICYSPVRYSTTGSGSCSLVYIRRVLRRVAEVPSFLPKLCVNSSYGVVANQFDWSSCTGYISLVPNPQHHRLHHRRSERQYTARLPLFSLIPVSYIRGQGTHPISSISSEGFRDQ